MKNLILFLESWEHFPSVTLPHLSSYLHNPHVQFNNENLRKDLIFGSNLVPLAYMNRIRIFLSKIEFVRDILLNEKSYEHAVLGKISQILLRLQRFWSQFSSRVVFLKIDVIWRWFEQKWLFCLKMDFKWNIGGLRYLIMD